MIYRKPTAPHIARTKETRTLYVAEARLARTMGEITAELTKHLGLGEERTDALPEALFQTLRMFDNGAAEMAAKTFLETLGYSFDEDEEEGGGG